MNLNRSFLVHFVAVGPCELTKSFNQERPKIIRASGCRLKNEVRVKSLISKLFITFSRFSCVAWGFTQRGPLLFGRSSVFVSKSLGAE